MPRLACSAVDDHGAGDRVLERSQARFQHHLLLTHIVVLVVVRALAVGPRLAQPLLDVVAALFAQSLELASQLVQAGARHGYRRPFAVTSGSITWDDHHRYVPVAQ